MNNELKECVDKARKIATSTGTVGDFNQLYNLERLFDAVESVEDIETYVDEEEKKDDIITLL